MLKELEINQSYYIANDIPSHEIDKAIKWLEGVKKNAANQIERLENIKIARNRSKRWRNDINNLVNQFKRDEYLQLNLKEKIVKIRRELDCSHARAEFIAKRVHTWARELTNKKRDMEIVFMRANGSSVPEIAKKHDLSRQQVYNILKKQENGYSFLSET